MHRKVAAALLAVLTLGLAAAGCGSSAGSLTRAELASRIEAACRQAQADVQRANARGGSSRGPTEFIAAVVTSQRGLVAKLEDYEAPSDAAADFNAFKQGLKQRIELFSRVLAAGSGGFQRAMAAAEAQGKALTERSQQAAARLDVRGCI